MLTYVWLVIKIVAGLLLVVTLAGAAFLFFAPVFGGKPTGDSAQRIQASANHNGSVFVNLVPTIVNTPDPSATGSLLDFFNPPAGKNPQTPLPSTAFSPSELSNDTFVWFGHSTILFKTAGITVLTDPIFNAASPVPFIVKPFSMTSELSVDSLPEVDVVLISHDHYDHLDYKAIQVLDSKVKQFFVPLGVKAHLLRWGISNAKIIEFDWYDNASVASLELTLTPSRHFSGRGLTNRSRTLWGSWVVKSETLNLFFSGDSGYYEEFKKIGKNHGPFDIAFLENGAYNTFWSQIHMVPEDSVQASIDLQASVFFPIHWGKFDLSLHPWHEPVERALAAAKKNDVKIATPRIGELFTTTNYSTGKWWLEVE